MERGTPVTAFGGAMVIINQDGDSSSESPQIPSEMVMRGLVGQDRSNTKGIVVSGDQRRQVRDD